MACCTVIGIPGRIIQQKGIKIQDPRGIDLDHHLVPDPVGKALSCLVDRLDELENNQKRFVVAEETCGSCEAEGVCHGEEVVVLKQAAGGK